MTLTVFKKFMYFFFTKMLHLSETDRAIIAGHLENDRKITDLDAEFGVVKSTVTRNSNLADLSPVLH
jgi:hypothetical protein